MVARQVVHHLASRRTYEDKLIDPETVTDKLSAVYELCLDLLDHPDGTVVTHSLETLQQLLKTPTEGFKQVLLSPAGIRTSRINGVTETASNNEDDDEAPAANADDANEEVLETSDAVAFNNLSKGTVEMLADEDDPGTLLKV